MRLVFIALFGSGVAYLVHGLFAHILVNLP